MEDKMSGESHFMNDGDNIRVIKDLEAWLVKGKIIKMKWSERQLIKMG
jgi:uncharacterized Zn ribbon protein